MMYLKRILGVLVIAAAVILPSGCGFTREVREASATAVPVATYQLAISNTSISWLVGILKARKQLMIERALELDPTLDPATIVVNVTVENADGTTEEVNIDEIITNLEKIIEMNLEAAHLLDTLNESIQANQGWNPIAGEIENLARDPEFQALVKAYAELLRKKKDGE